VFPYIWKDIEESLITLVYGSNMIESVGSTWNITSRLCRGIFRGNEVSANTNKYDAPLDYQDHINHLLWTNRKADKRNVILSRKEVIQHATALNFLIGCVVLDNQPCSEELILETHRIIYEGLDDNIVAGQYRDYEVAVSYHKPGEKRKAHMCLRAKAVPGYMRDMIGQLHTDIIQAEKSGELDPYTLAARYHHQFVMIHPFGDGNGRMARILLNVLLLKYAGHLSLFGSEVRDEAEYLSIVRRGRKIFDKEDREVDIDKNISHLEFARYVLIKSRTSLERMWTWQRYAARQRCE
jgi:Fic family protein